MRADERGHDPVAPPAPGRSCPLHYHYGPAVFRAEAPRALSGLDTLYVVGGLYGNELALHEVLRHFEREQGRAALLFNGDFHWFDIDPAVFARIQGAVLSHQALRGNVEEELVHGDPAAPAGCGCAYPPWVADAVVARSNRIHARLVAAATSPQRAQLAGLPMWQRADVGPLRLGIVHGDAQSLAGWGFAQEHLATAAQRAEVATWFDAAGVDAFACTHTCLPVFQALTAGTGPGRRWVLNNGAAGMPNFAGDAAGLLTRISTRPLPPGLTAGRRFGVNEREVHIDALAVAPDAADVQRRFLAQWPAGSDAHASYWERIVHGPQYHVDQAIRGVD